MSAMPRAATLELYQGTEGFVYEEERYTITIPGEESAEHSMFYELVRGLSTVVASGFAVLLILSLITGGPVHWALSVVGLLGSVGFAGAVWLSKPYLRRQSFE